MRGLLCTILMCGCTDSPHLWWSSALAVGSTGRAGVSYQECRSSPDPGDSCHDVYIPTESARIDHTEIFSIEVAPVPLGDINAPTMYKGAKFTALAPGAATLTLVADGE